MATFHGTDGVAEFGANAVAEVTAFNCSGTADLVEDSACGDEFKTYKPGKKDGSGKLDCWWDPTDTNGQASISEGDEVALTLYPAGTDAGNGKVSGTVRVETLDLNHTQDGIVQASFSFRGYMARSLVV